MPIQPIPPIDPFLGYGGPFPQTIKFAYQEGEQLVAYTERIARFVREQLTPSIDGVAKTLVEYFDTEVSKVIANIQNALADQDDLNEVDRAAAAAYVDREVAKVIGNSIELQDVVLKAIAQDTTSAAGIYLRTLFASKATQTAIEAGGRLSAEKLAEAFASRTVQTLTEAGGRLSQVELDKVFASKAIQVSAETGRLSANTLASTFASKAVELLTEAGGRLSQRKINDNINARYLPPVMGKWWAALACRNDRPVIIVTAGSSTTQGYNSAADGRWVDQFAKAVQQGYPLKSGGAQADTRSLGTLQTIGGLRNGIQFVNVGISGADSSTYLPTATIDALRVFVPDAVFHMIGSNDWKDRMPLATYKANIKDAIAKLDANRAKTPIHFLIHSFERFDGVTNPIPWSGMGETLREIESELDNAMVLDISAPFYAVGVPGTDPFGLMDGGSAIHVGDDGQTMIADIVRNLLHVPGPVISPTAVSHVQVSPERLASDSFGTDGPLVGRVTNNPLGGAGRTWMGDGGYDVAGNKIIPSSRNASSFTGYAVTGDSAQVSVLVNALPTSQQWSVDLYRDSPTGGGATSGYRLGFAYNRLELNMRNDGVSTVLFTMAEADRIIDSVFTLRWYRNYLSLLREGEEIFRIKETTVPRGGYVGFSRAGSHVGGALSRWVHDILA
jgi:lysophospholipase L1-like esterase